MKRISVSHQIGEVVYLKTDPEQAERIVGRLNITQSGVEYGLRKGADDPTWHQACEISRQPRPKKSPGFR